MTQKQSIFDDKQFKNGGTLSAYINEMKKYPQLKHADTIELFKLLEQGGKEAEKARKKIINSNLRLVISIAKQYKNQNIPLEDLIQEGNIGLMKSIERFEWKKGFRFSTYATWWVKQAIGQHMLKTRRLIRLPAHAVSLQKKLISATDEYRKHMGCEPTIEELQELVNASEAVIKATMNSGRGAISMQQSSSCNEHDTIENHLEDPDYECNPFDSVSEIELISITKKILSSLSEKEEAILRLRFGLFDDPTNHKDYPITEDEYDSIRNKGIGLQNVDIDANIDIDDSTVE